MSIFKGITTEEEEYQRKFFLLKVFVLGGVGSVLTILAALFWAYFMYLWRTLDNSLKRDHVIGGGPGGGVDYAAMAVQEAANQAAMEKAALDLAETSGTHFTTGMLPDNMLQVNIFWFLSTMLNLRRGVCRNSFFIYFGT